MSSVGSVLLVALCIISLENSVRSADTGSWVKSLRAGSQVYEITKTWDGDDLPVSEIITVTLSASTDPPANVEQLVISVEAPFFDDPHINDTIPPETMDGLWDYEVVEVFLLGPNDHYLEIELSPKGQYLLLELVGSRNVIRDKLPLYKKNYVAEINGTKNRWTGRAVIPNCYLPPDITKFNAYAIHGSDDLRIYKSLFPATKGELEGPDFHALKYFGDIDFESILPRESSTLTEEEDTSNENNNGVKSFISFIALTCSFVVFTLTSSIF